MRLTNERLFELKSLKRRLGNSNLGTVSVLTFKEVMSHIETIEQELLESKQSELMHQQDVNALTHQNNNLVNEVSVLEQMNLKLREETVLPEDVAAALEQVWESNSNSNVVKHLYMTNWNQIRSDHPGQLFETLSDYAKAFPTEYMAALVNGYIVETPEDANEKAFRAGMDVIYEEMDSLKYKESFNWQEVLTEKIIPLISSIYYK
jgi:hypothetical protein